MKNSTDEHEETAGEKTPHLSISSHVVVQLGSELVTDVEQALLELAKNAYDADSAACEITVEPEWEITPEDPVYDLLYPAAENIVTGPQKVGRLTIRDYGQGIAPNAVDLGWLRISASLKRAVSDQQKVKTKRYHRTPVGDKGLGRLATMKIGTVLRLKTAIEGENAWRTVAFSWGEFTPERTLDQIRVLKGTDSSPPVEESGTIIEIIKLNDPNQWRDLDFIEKELIPNLSSLVSPFKTQDDFSINVTLGTKVYDLDTVQEDVLNLASAKFTFSWDGTTLTQKSWLAPSLFRGASSVEEQYRFDKLFSPENKPKLVKDLLEDKRLRGRNGTANVEPPWLVHYSESNEFPNFPIDKLYPGGVNPGPFEAEIHYFMFNKPTRDKLQQAGMSVMQMQAMAHVAIYRDGFRVRAQKDWLRLSESATRGGSFYELRPSNVLGFFAVSNEFNAGLVEKSDREGFVDNREFRGFMTLSQRCKSYANSILESARRTVNDSVAKVIARDEISPLPRELVARLSASERSSKIDIEKAKSTINKALRDLSSVKSRVDTFEKATELPIQPISSTSAELNRSLQTLESIEAKLSEHSRLSEALNLIRLSDDEQKERLLDAAAVGLSARSLSHELHQYVRQLRDGIAVISEQNKALRDEKIRNATRSLNSVTRELAKTVAAIDPLLPGSRSLKENIKTLPFLSQFHEARSAQARIKNVELILDIPADVPDLEVRFSRARLLQILENLFQNSLYWVTHGPTAEPQLKQIVIRATSTGFTWEDSGPGISPSIEASIFDPFVSDKPSTEGQGLGLHIVSSFLEAEKCSIQLAPDKNSLGRRYKFLVNLSPAKFEQKQTILFPNNG